MTIQPIITTATSQTQREEAERSGLPWFVASFEAFLIAARSFHGQDDIDPAALISGIAEIRARRGRLHCGDLPRTARPA